MCLIMFPLRVPLQSNCNDRTVAPFHCGGRCYCLFRVTGWVLHLSSAMCRTGTCTSPRQLLLVSLVSLPFLRVACSKDREGLHVCQRRMAWGATRSALWHFLLRCSRLMIPIDIVERDCLLAIVRTLLCVEPCPLYEVQQKPLLSMNKQIDSSSCCRGLVNV